MKLIAVSLLLTIAAFSQARTRRADYALVLEDPPVAQQVQSRASLQSQAAQAHRKVIRTAQSGVLSELARRKVPVTATADLLVNCVFVRATQLEAGGLAAIPGVKRVQYLPP